MKMCETKSKYKNKVAFIQSEQVFECEKDETGLCTVTDYLKIKKSQFLESKDVEEIYSFIYDHAKKNKIYKFVCHIDSGVLEELMDHMYKIKNKNSKVRALLNKCTFIATYSNANNTRVKNASTGSMFYFALSPLDVILNNVPNGKVGTDKEILVCLSNSKTPYYDQIDKYFVEDGTTVQKVFMDKLTAQVVDSFSSSGYMVIASLDTEEEYKKFSDVMKESKYRKLIHFIELTRPDAVDDLRSAGFSSIQTSSSGVCINGTGYVGLNTLIAYEVCAAALTVCWRSWSRFIEAKVLSLK